ncbi:MAG: Gfo/Idh/MocA family oxidoreductase [Pseudomonadota bacterium]
MDIALIGLGMVADTHLHAIAATKELRLSVVMSRKSQTTEDFADKAAALTGKRPIPVTSVDAVIAAAPDFVILATPPSARLDLVRDLAAAGLPILMEKPVERSLSIAQRVVDLCDIASVPLGIMLQHRMRPAALRMRKLLSDGDLGTLGLVEVHVPWWRQQSYYDTLGRGTYERDGGGVLINQAIHMLDLALNLVGPVTEVTAALGTSALHRMEGEDIAVAGIGFTNGLLGMLTATTAAFPGRPESMALHGTLGSARLQSGRLHLDWQDGRSEIEGDLSGTGSGADPMDFPHEWHQAVIEDFATALRTRRAPKITGKSALRAHRVIDAMERASENGERVSLLRYDDE